MGRLQHRKKLAELKGDDGHGRTAPVGRVHLGAGAGKCGSDYGAKPTGAGISLHALACQVGAGASVDHAGLRCASSPRY